MSTAETTTSPEALMRLLDKLFRGERDPERMCGCGTYRDALEVAFKEVNQRLEQDCPLWAIQVCAAFYLLGNAVSIGVCGTEDAFKDASKAMAPILAEDANAERVRQLLVAVLYRGPLGKLFKEAEGESE